MENREVMEIHSYIPILEYHDLGLKSGEKKTFHSPYILEPKKFHNHLQWLQEHLFQTISIDDLFDDIIRNKSVILTFDDGHVSSYEYALPLLREFNFQATFFLVAQFIGRKNYLTIEQIQEMQEAGMRFESHSLTHPYLLSLDKGAMAYEVSESKAVIESIVKQTVNHFCIPYGFYNKELFKCVADAGYKSVVTERMSYYGHNQSPFKVLPRFTIKANIAPNDFVNIMGQHRSKMASRYFVECILHGTKKILGFKGYMRLKSLIVQSAKQRKRCVAKS